MGVAKALRENGRVRIYVAGTVCVETAEGCLSEDDLPGPKAVFVLVRLAVDRPGTVRREDLAELLWADTPPSRWEVDLRANVSRLRSALRRLDDRLARAVVARGPGYRLRLGPEVWLDVDHAARAVHEAERTLRAGDPRSAATSAWVAEAIASRGFLDHQAGAWVESQRVKLERIRLRALDALSAALSELGDHAEAIRHAEQAVEIDAFRERSHRGLMAAYAAAGDHGRAASTYRALEVLLADELGVTPSPQTTQAYHGVVRQVAGPAEPGARHR